MKGFRTFIIGFILIMVNCFFMGFIYMEMYELAVAPLLNYLGNAPYIPYGCFVLLNCVFALYNSNNDKKKKYAEMNAEFWIDYLTTIVNKLIILGITFMFNLMFV